MNGVVGAHAAEFLSGSAEPPLDEFLSGSAKPPLDKVRLTLARATYEVRGSTADQLRAMLEGRGPLRAAGRFPGYTDWTVNWPDDPVAPIDVEVVATITLPTWEPPPWATLELRAVWDAYVAALERHEQGHVRIAVGAAEAVRHAIATAHAGTARSAGEEAIRAARLAEIEYDRATDHGKREGAVLVG